MLDASGWYILFLIMTVTVVVSVTGCVGGYLEDKIGYRFFRLRIV